MSSLRWLGKPFLGAVTLIVAVLQAEARPQPKPPARYSAAEKSTDRAAREARQAFLTAIKGILDAEGAEK